MKDRPPVTNQQYWVYKFSPEEPPMTEWGKVKYQAAKVSYGPKSVPIADANDPVLHGCYPPGVPRIYLQLLPLQIVQTRGETIMLFEYDSLRRQIFTDGRAHDTDLGPTWMGDSVGHWDGGTLVVDTTNFNEKTWLDRMGHPHSDALHLIERFRRIDRDHMTDDVTVDDPKAYTRAWTAHLDFVLKPSWTLAERFCKDDESFTEFEKGETKP